MADQKETEKGPVAGQAVVIAPEGLQAMKKLAEGLAAKAEGIFTPPFIQIKWQEGVVKNGVANGAMIEDIIDLLISRLEGFNAGPLSCRENAKSIAYLIQAKQWQLERSLRRRAQGVEGTSKPHS